MQDSCFKKCVTSYSESELAKGESTCIDRCVYKYSDASDKISHRLQQLLSSQPGNQ